MHILDLIDAAVLFTDVRKEILHDDGKGVVHRKAALEKMGEAASHF